MKRKKKATRYSGLEKKGASLAGLSAFKYTRYGYTLQGEYWGKSEVWLHETTTRNGRRKRKGGYATS